MLKSLKVYFKYMSIRNIKTKKKKEEKKMKMLHKAQGKVVLILESVMKPGGKVY